MGIHLKSVLAKGLMGATLAFALVGCGSTSEPQAATEDVVQETWPYAEAMEYIIASAPQFGVALYQSPTGADIAGLIKAAGAFSRNCD